MAKKERISKGKAIVVHYRNVVGRLEKVGKCYKELFVSSKNKGKLTPDGKQLRWSVWFPDYETAVTYVVNRSLGYAIEPPSFGHWIDPNYWTPLCIIPPKEIKDG